MTSSSSSCSISPEGKLRQVMKPSFSDSLFASNLKTLSDLEIIIFTGNPFKRFDAITMKLCILFFRVLGCVFLLDVFQGIVKHPFNEKLLLATRKFEETLARFELIFTLITCITYGQNCISPGKL